MKKLICAVFAAMSVLCVGCGDADDGFDGTPARMCSVVLLGFENDNAFIGGYNSRFDHEKTPKVELEINKEYHIFFWRNGYSQYYPFDLENHKDGFDAELDYCSFADIDQPETAYLKPILCKNISQTYTLGFDVDTDIACIKCSTVSNISEKSSLADRWCEYSITGYRTGEIVLTVVAVNKSEFSHSGDWDYAFRFNIALKFTSPEFIQ